MMLMRDEIRKIFSPGGGGGMDAGLAVPALVGDLYLACSDIEVEFLTNNNNTKTCR